MSTEQEQLPELVRFLKTHPDSGQLLHVLLEAAAWSASAEADRMPILRRDIAAEFANLVRLEAEIRTLRSATETRWDGRTSAFMEADAVASEDRDAVFRSLNRLATMMDAAGVTRSRP